MAVAATPLDHKGNDMLRTAKSVHLGLVLSGAHTSNDGSTISFNTGNNDFASGARGAAGKQTITQRELGLHKRGPIVLVTPGANIANGAFGTYDANPASGVVASEVLNSSGAGDDGDTYVMTAGFINSFTDVIKSPKQRVVATFPGPVLMGFRVTNSGSVAIASGNRQGSAVRNGAGDVTITLTHPLARYRTIAVSCENATAAYCIVTALSATSFTVKTFDSSAVAADVNFHVLLLGSNSSFRAGRMRKNLQVPQLNPRIIVGKLVDSAGTPTISIGGATNGIDFTVTDDGTGAYTITLARPFKRLPVVCCTAKATNAQLSAAPTVSAFSILCSNDSGTATDDDVNFVALGYDTTLEY